MIIPINIRLAGEMQFADGVLSEIDKLTAEMYANVIGSL
jgi:hypothetical protein